MTSFDSDVNGIIWELIKGIFTKIIPAVMKMIHAITHPGKNLKREAEQVTWNAKNPKANEQMLSIAPCGVFFGKQAIKCVTKRESMDGHVLVVGGPAREKAHVLPFLR